MQQTGTRKEKNDQTEEIKVIQRHVVVWNDLLLYVVLKEIYIWVWLVVV